MTMKQDRMGLADVLVTPRLAVWLVASPAGEASLLRDGSLSGQDILALGLLGGASSLATTASALDAELELPFMRPEAAKGRSFDDDEDEDEIEDEDDDEEDEDEEDEDEEDDYDDEDDDDDDDDDDDEDEDDEDFLDDDEDDDYDDDDDEDEDDDDDFEDE